MESTGISWINIIREDALEKMDRHSDGYERKVLITDQFKAYIETVLKTQLLPHQKCTLFAMIELEMERHLKIGINNVNFADYSDPLLETSAGIVSEKPGSGKTYEIFALITVMNRLYKEKKVKPTPEITSFNLAKPGGIYSARITSQSRNEGYHNNGFSTEVRKTYNTLFRQTLIFVGKSVLGQWEERAEKYTDLRTLVIKDIYDLRSFYQMIFEPTKKSNMKDFNKYDIVIIKNGSVSGKFDVNELKDTKTGKNKAKSMLGIFAELFKYSCWTRVVLDDFDTLSIPTNAMVIPALFTWFISATKKSSASKRNGQQYHTIEEMLFSHRPTYSGIWSNKYLFTYFNIGCDNSFIDQSTMATQIKYYIYKFHNPNDQFIGLIGNMGGDRNRLIAEMLNSDATLTAAKQAGIKTNSVADIFEAILDQSWSVYKKNLKVDRYLTKIKEFIGSLPSLSDLKKSISATALDNFRRNLKKPGPFSAVKDTVKYQQSSVNDTIQSVEDTNTHDKEENGKAIQRVKDKLREGDCPITCEELKSCPNIIVLRCCGTVLSLEGARMLSNGNCPNCRTRVDGDRFIIIDQDIDINKILEDDVLSDEEEETFDVPKDLSKEEDEVEEEISTEITKEEDDLNLDDLDELNQSDNEEEEHVSLKFGCVIDIVLGNTRKLEDIQEERNDILIPNLLEGSNDAGFANPEDSKIVIYAQYKEQMDIIDKKLNRKGIAYAHLHGTNKQIEDIKRRYWLDNSDEESIKVLLINGPKYSAGLDLQNTTDFILPHEIVNKNIETQIVGRGARYGRKNNLRIHYVLYDNEYQKMFSNRRTR